MRLLNYIISTGHKMMAVSEFHPFSIVKNFYLEQNKHFVFLICKSIQNSKINNLILTRKCLESQSRLSLHMDFTNASAKKGAVKLKKSESEVKADEDLLEEKNISDSEEELIKPVVKKRGRPAKNVRAVKKTKNEVKSDEDLLEEKNLSDSEEEQIKPDVKKRQRQIKNKPAMKKIENVKSNEDLLEEKIVSDSEEEQIKPKVQKRERSTNNEPDSKKAKLETGQAKEMPAKTLINKASTDYSTINFECDKKSSSGDSWNFKISSWNVDGIRAWLYKGGLEFIDHEQPDILCLQETKCSDGKRPPEVKSLPNYFQYWMSSEKEGYAGVGILSKKEAKSVKYGLDNEEFDSEGRIITAEFDKFYLICTYVPNAGRGLVTLPKRLEWNTIFREHVKKLNEEKPVIVCGDMNVSHLEIDLSNPKTSKKLAGFTHEERHGMTEFLKDGYVDTFRKLYPDKIGAYTFWTYMMNCRSKNVGWRLDYFIVSESLMDSVCDNVIRNQIYGSDHCPLTLFLHMKD